MLLDAGGDCEHVGIEHDVLRREAGVLGEQVVGATENLGLSLDGLCLTALVEGHQHDGGAVAAHLPRLGEEVLLSLLERDRVDDTLSLKALQPGYDDLPAGAVDHHGQPRHLGLGGHEVEEHRHRVRAVEQVCVHVHVEQVGAAPYLVERDVERALPVVGLDQPSEDSRAGDVRALADDDEGRVLVDDERLETAEPGSREAGGDPPRCKPVHRRRDGREVLRGGAATPAHAVDEPVLGEDPQQARRLLGCLVVAAERVGQSGVRIADHRYGCDPGEIRQERAHLGGAERTVDPHCERLRVLDRNPERLHRLAGSVRPLRSTTVTETTRGIRPPRSSSRSFTAAIAAFAFRVSNTVSMSRRSAPPSSRPRATTAYPSRISSNVAARWDGPRPAVRATG